MSKLSKIVPTFLREVQKISEDEKASEGSYYHAIKGLIEKIGENVSVLIQPGMITGVFPDFRIKRNKNVIGFVEQKDLGYPLPKLSAENKKQQRKYLQKFPNLIYTNCLDWDFYSNGERINSVRIGKFESGKIIANTDEFPALIRQIEKFINGEPIAITESSVLSLHMADIARLLKKNIMEGFEAKSFNGNFSDMYKQCKRLFSVEYTEEEFAETYAETATFGLFMSRLQNNDSNQIDRNSAAGLIRNNEFLKFLLFDILTGSSAEGEMTKIYDEMVEILNVCDMEQIMKGFTDIADTQSSTDPINYFYENFSKDFSKAKRDKRGMWSTPQPVVRLIIQAVDDLLVKEFNIPDGLAENTKIDSNSNDPVNNIHRVQILDPAVGTGTFLADAINFILSKRQHKNRKFQNNFIEHEILPRMHGFEILMVPYILSQIRLGMTLQKQDYSSSNGQPIFSIFRTDSLDLNDDKRAITTSKDWFAEESNRAANVSAEKVKAESSFLCIVGNPPYYTKDSRAEGELGELMNDYFLIPDSEERIKGNTKSIHNSYVKFIRSASHIIENKKEGILGFVTDHGFLENRVFHGMRWHLLNTFDKIWVLDLHGNSLRREVTPEGEPDKNVFKIQTGVSIIIAMKSKTGSNGLAKIWHGELWGSKESKYETLKNGRITSKSLFKRITPRNPDYYFEDLDYEKYDQYNKGYCLSEIFPTNSPGIATGWDKFATDEVQSVLISRLQKFNKQDVAESNLTLKKGSEKLLSVKQDIGQFDESKLVKMCYRPFEDRWVYYTGKSEGIIGRPRDKVMRNLIGGENLALISSRQQGCVGYHHVFASNKIVNDCAVSNLSKEACYVFPLYTFNKNEGNCKQVNMDSTFREKIEEIAACEEFGKPDELAIFDYIYGVLHCPDYRGDNARFLRKDFPRIPLPTSKQVFWDISIKGGKLRELHVFQKVDIDVSTYELSDGSNVISNVTYDPTKGIKINEYQFFENVPEEIWKFRIGGYYPAKEWLMNFKNRKLARQTSELKQEPPELNLEASEEYRKILKILHETDKIMKTISMRIDD